MFFGELAFVFEVMLYVGLGLPLVNLLLSLFGSLGGSGSGADADVDADVDVDIELDGDVGWDADADLDLELDAPDLDLDFDAGDVELELDGAGAAASGATAAHGGGFPLRFNMYCLCFAFVVMGAMGIFALERFEGAMRAVMLAVGVVLALAAYVLLYRLVVRPLKQNDARALNAESLRYRHAIVTFRILSDSPGTIRTRDATGAVISYRAEMDADVCRLGRLEEGTEVIITDLDKEKRLCYVTLAQRKILN